MVERTEYAPRHVTYGLTSRGAALMPVLATIASWGDTYWRRTWSPTRPPVRWSPSGSRRRRTSTMRSP
ncbi:winged helix-turn-helix transcriptional regulator [Streptomyces sp. M10(2022)]